MVRFECNECGKTYPHRNTLYRHVTSKHLDSENFECNECGKMFGLKKNLYRHILAKHLDSESFECSACGKKYRYKHDLRSHIFLKHTANKNYEKKDRKFKCNKCCKAYHYKSSLDRHVSLKHSDSGKIKCYQCGEKYMHYDDLKSHMYSRHSTKSQIERRNFTCLLCFKSLSSEFGILNHFKSTHQLEILIENHSFENERRFLIWKSEIQLQNCCTYRKCNRYKNDNTNKTTVIFRCNRNGFYTPNTPPHFRQRKLKMQGSKKLNGFCPSKIILHIEGDGVHTVLFTKSHVGHSNDDKELAHMNYSRKEKKIISEKMRRGIPVSQIVEDLVIGQKVNDHGAELISECAETDSMVSSIEVSIEEVFLEPQPIETIEEVFLEPQPAEMIEEVFLEPQQAETSTMPSITDGKYDKLLNMFRELAERASDEEKYLMLIEFVKEMNKRFDAIDARN